MHLSIFDFQIAVKIEYKHKNIFIDKDNLSRFVF